MKEVEEKLGLTKRLIVLGVIYVCLMVILNNILEWFTIWWKFLYLLPIPMLILMFIVYALDKYTPIHFTRQEVAIIIMLGALAAHAGGPHYTGTGTVYWGAPVSIPTFIGLPITLSYSPTYVGARQFMSALWFTCPQDTKVLDIVWNGARGRPWSWDPWIIPILWWSILLFLAAGWALHIYLLWMRPLIDVEKLPFPYAQPAITIINTHFDKKWGFRKSPALWVGIFIGFAFGIPDVLNYIIPAIPPGIYYAYYTLDLRPYLGQLLRGATLYTGFYWFHIFFQLLYPLDTLLTAWITNLILWVIYPTIGVSAGFLPYFEESATSMWVYGVTTGPFRYWYFCGFGVLFGIVLWAIFAHQTYFINSIRAALGRTSLPEEKEPGNVSYRFIWGGLAIFTLALWIFLIASGLHPVFVIPYSIFNLLFFVGTGILFSRSYGLGWWAPNARAFLWDIGRATGVLTEVPGTNQTTFNLMFYHSCILGNGGMANASPFASAGFGGFTTLKMLREEKVPIKDFVKTWWLFCIIVIPLGITFGVWAYNTWGYANLSIVNYGGWEAGNVASDYVFRPPYGVESLDGLHWMWAGLGIVFTFLIGFIKMRFPAFFVDPVGIVWGALPYNSGMYLGIFLMWLVKFLVVRYGGARVYEQYIVPWVCGWTLGYAVFSFLIFWIFGLPGALSKLATGV